MFKKKLKKEIFKMVKKYLICVLLKYSPSLALVVSKG